MSDLFNPERKPVKVLALLEASSVTGVARNLLEFSTRARRLTSADGLCIHTSFATFIREPSSPLSAPGNKPRGHRATTAGNEFISVALGAGIDTTVVAERFRFDPRVIGALRELVAEREPDILQTHSVKSHFLLRMSGLWRDRPWIAFHHGYTSTDLKMRAYNQLDRWSLGRARRVITVSREFAVQLSRIGVPRDQIGVLANAIDPARIRNVRGAEGAEIRRKLGLGDDESLILSVGRLSKEKGHLDLVHAVGRLVAARPCIKVRLAILGKGPERDRLQAAALANGISDRVLLTGHVADVTPYYAAADLMVLPSHSEGCPNVLLEGMAAALPIVATEVGSIPDIVRRNREALLVKAGDSASMARAMSLLLEDRHFSAEIGQNARARVQERYSPEARWSSLAKIYAEVMRLAA